MSNPILEHVKLTFNTGSALRDEVLEGRSYCVAPMVMLTEGVHTGSQGALYYPKDELSKTPVVWNHKPIVVYHPEINGQGVSACSPEIVENQKVGIIFNTVFDGKLRAEAWFDKEKLPKVDNRIWEAIQKNEMVELSTGLFTDNTKTPGSWNGEAYDAIAKNYRPDHLAILPDRIGACSIADGAGLLQLNEEEASVYNRKYSMTERKKMDRSEFGDPKNMAFPVKTQEDLNNAARLIGHAQDPSAVKKRLMSIAAKKHFMLPKAWQSHPVGNNIQPMTANELSYDNVRSQIRETLKAEMQKAVATATGMDMSYSPYVYLEDVFQTFFIYSCDGCNGDLWMRGYSVGNDIVVLSDTPATEVQRVIEYRSVADDSYVGNSGAVLINKEKESMANPNVPAAGAAAKTKEERVKALIGNNWTEADREWLMGLDEAKLDKMVVKPAATTTPIVPVPELVAANTAVVPPVVPVVPAAPVVPAPAPRLVPMTEQEYINNAPPGIREVLINSLATMNQVKQNHIAVILANKQNKFTVEMLKDRSPNELAALAALAAPVAPTQLPGVYNYGGAVGGGIPTPPTGNAHVEEPMSAPKMDFSKPN